MFSEQWEGDAEAVDPATRVSAGVLFRSVLILPPEISDHELLHPICRGANRDVKPSNIIFVNGKARLAKSNAQGPMDVTMTHRLYAEEDFTIILHRLSNEILVQNWKVPDT